MMSEMVNTLSKDLEAYGLSSDEIKVFLYTSYNKGSTALKISKDTHLSRTKVYRVLDKLLEKELVTQNMGERGYTFEANDPSVFTLLLKEKELELHNLSERLPFVMEKLSGLTVNSDDTSKVKYYAGVEGLKQVTWNSLRAEKHIRIMEVSSDMSKFLDQKFSEEVRRELVKRRIHTMQLTNLSHIPKFTNVTEKVKNYWEVHYISPKKLKIGFEFLVYNDVVVLYSVHDKDVFCVEIYDKRLAEMQKNLFDFIWNSTERMKILNENGEAILEN